MRHLIEAINLAMAAADHEGLDPDPWSPPRVERSVAEGLRRQRQAEIKRLQRQLKRCAPDARPALQEELEALCSPGS